MYSKKDENVGFVIMGAITVIILTVILMPLIIFWCGYLGGLIAKMTIGVPLCQGLNTLFKTTYFVPENLPWYAATLAWIGSYFKSTSTVKSNS